MAVDVCTEISSPRISFSHDLIELDLSPVENHNRRSDPSLLNPTVDFDFCTGHGFRHEISSADELFDNGVILPIEIKKTHDNYNPPKEEIHLSQPQKDDVVFENENKQKKRLIEFLSNSSDADEEDEKPSWKPFWQFRRSSSASSENGRANGLFRFRSLQFLTRSKSTGSVPNPKKSGFSKPIQKQHSLKEGSINYRPSSTVNYYSNNSNNNNSNTTSKRPFLRKSVSRTYASNGVRFNPVLNIPPAYIAKGTISLFGIGSLFCSKKSKKKR